MVRGEFNYNEKVTLVLAIFVGLIINFNTIKSLLRIIIQNAEYYKILLVILKDVSINCHCLIMLISFQRDEMKDIIYFYFNWYNDFSIHCLLPH